MKLTLPFKQIPKNMTKQFARSVLTLFIGLLSFMTTKAQVEINLETFTTSVDKEIVVVLTANNFEQMVAMQFSLNWDPTVLEFKEVGDFNIPDLTVNSFNTTVAESGELSVAWFDPDVDGHTITDGTNIFSLTFTKLSEVPTSLFFDNTPTKIEFVAFPFNEVSLNSMTTEVVTTGRLLEGKVLFDENDNCSLEEAEKGLRDWTVKISGTNNRFKRTDENGIFRAFLPFGDYQVEAIPPPNNLFAICEPIQNISILEGATESVNIAFAGQATIDCPSMSVEIGTPFLRRCFENTYRVTYCNNGTIAAEDAYVQVTLDPAMNFIESSLTGTMVETDVYRFEIGTVDLNDCGSFTIKVKVDCDEAELGQTHCVIANIFPDMVCTSPSANWNGASLELEGECVEEEGVLQLRIKNIGDGSMDLEQQFIVMEDMIMLRSATESTYQLQSGETKTLEYAANGATYRLETNQVPNHPQEMPLAIAIEGCGTNDQGTFSMGMINMFPMADEGQFEDIDCQQNIGAFDPNDKNAFPNGYQDQHYLEPNTEISYHIRFQNTGTDTAFNIVVLDTLSELLDVATFVPLVSSHPYELEVVDSNILKYSFNNIMLPDSNINEAGSHGFFKFKIQQQPDVALGSVIENSAAIYFDFNEPIITNTYFHTIGIDFLEFRLISPTNNYSPINLSVSPNPMGASAIIKVDNKDNSVGVFQLFDLQGKQVATYQFSGNEFRLERGDLPSGMYLFEVIANGVSLGNGKLVIKVD